MIGWCGAYAIGGVLLISAAILSAEELVWPSLIEVITDSRHPVKALDRISGETTVRQYYLDAPKQLEAELSAGLAAELSLAKQQALARLHRMGKHDMQRQFTIAYGGLIKALSYRIDRYPAVVFDNGQAVIYGVTDLEQALHHYRRWRASRQHP